MNNQRSIPAGAQKNAQCIYRQYTPLGSGIKQFKADLAPLLVNLLETDPDRLFEAEPGFQ